MAPTAVFSAGNTALITGAASGIGFAVAQLCKKHGMKLALVDINNTHLENAKKEIGEQENVETYVVDVSKPDQWNSLKEKVNQKFGSVDLLMLNAGVGGQGTWGNAEYFHKVRHLMLTSQQVIFDRDTLNVSISENAVCTNLR